MEVKEYKWKYIVKANDFNNHICLAWLIVWDRLFGTFQEEKEDEEIVYGLVGQQVESFNPLYLQVIIWASIILWIRLLQSYCIYQQLFYFRNIYDKLCSMSGWKNKMFSLIKGPGWTPGSPWTGNIDDVPEVKDDGQKKIMKRNIVFQLFHFRLNIERHSHMDQCLIGLVRMWSFTHFLPSSHLKMSTFSEM